MFFGGRPGPRRVFEERFFRDAVFLPEKALFDSAFFGRPGFFFDEVFFFEETLLFFEDAFLTGFFLVREGPDRDADLAFEAVFPEEYFETELLEAFLAVEGLVLRETRFLVERAIIEPPIKDLNVRALVLRPNIF